MLRCDTSENDNLRIIETADKLIGVTLSPYQYLLKMLLSHLQEISQPKSVLSSTGMEGVS